MGNYSRYLDFLRQHLFILIAISLIVGFSLFWLGETKEAEAELAGFLIEGSPDALLIFQENTLLPITNPSNPNPKILREIKVIITAYSSTTWETDDTPFITASGTQVREGIVANNSLPIGTKIRIPELYGDKIFVVEDRMNWEKGKYHIDIWFPDYWQALDFGTKRTYIEVLEG
jgi:3D (Asp-Asp-Asp) domain-containing protein